MSAKRADQAMLGIRDLLESGTLVAGDRLQEVVLSERLGISRTPLRSALAQLSEDGLIEHLPSGGYAVRKFSRADIMDAIELRGVLEGTAARLAAERGITEAQAAHLHMLLDEMDIALDDGESRMDLDSYSELNAELHQLLAGLGGEIVRREIEHVSRLPFASPNALLEQQLDMSAYRRSLLAAQEQHRALVHAIVGREGARAESLAREHARLTRQNFETALDKDQSVLGDIPALRTMID